MFFLKNRLSNIQPVIFFVLLFSVVGLAFFGYLDKSFPIFYAALLGGLTAMVYYLCSEDIADKLKLSKVIILLSVSVALIIGLIKGSLALSLGLVGALSIVRFRTPIKDPLQLTFLFVAIAIGIGAGAQFYSFTAVGALIILTLIAAMSHSGLSPKLLAKPKYEAICRLQFESNKNFCIERDVFERYQIKANISNISEDGKTVVLMFVSYCESIAILKNAVSNAVDDFNLANADTPLSGLSIEYWCA